MMNLAEPIARELFRVGLLRTLAANGTQFGLTKEALSVLVVRFGFHPSHAEVAEEMQYLCDKGLVEPKAKQISTENKAWRITAAGRDYLAENE